MDPFMANTLVSSMCHLAIDTRCGTSMHAWMEKRKESSRRRGEDDVWWQRAVTPRFIRAGAMKKLHMHACSLIATMQGAAMATTTTTTPRWPCRCMPHASVGRGEGAGHGHSVAVWQLVLPRPLACSLQLKARVVWLWSRNTGEVRLVSLYLPRFPPPCLS